jgi:hypothetical protein
MCHVWAACLAVHFSVPEIFCTRARCLRGGFFIDDINILRTTLFVPCANGLGHALRGLVDVAPNENTFDLAPQ